MVNLFLTESDLKPQKLSRILFRTMAILLDSDLFRPLVCRCKIATTRNVSIKKDVFKCIIIQTLYFHAFSFIIQTLYLLNQSPKVLFKGSNKKII